MAYTDEELMALPPVSQPGKALSDEELSALPPVTPQVGMRTSRPKERGAMGEIYTGLRTGVTDYLPKMVGDAMQWAGEQGGAINALGKRISEEQAADMAKPENQLQPEKHNVVTNALASGAQMLAQSVAPAVVAAGAVAAGAAAVGAAPGAALASTVGLGLTALGGALPAGMSQAQQTYENVKAAGKSEEEAIAAGRASGAIEFLGETIGTYIGGKFVGVGAKALGFNKAVQQTTGKFIADATDPAVAKPFFKALVKTAAGEVATEVAQSYGEATVEQRAGVAVAPFEEAVGAIGPTLGMTVWLAPFGLAGNIRKANNAQAVNKALTTPEGTPKAARMEIVTSIAEEAKAQGVQDADAWLEGARFDVENGLPVRRTVEPTEEALAFVEAKERQAAADQEMAERAVKAQEEAAISDEIRREQLTAQEYARRKNIPKEAIPGETPERKEARERAAILAKEEAATAEYAPGLPGAQPVLQTDAKPTSTPDVEANKRSLEEARRSTSEETYSVFATSQPTPAMQAAEEKAVRRAAGTAAPVVVEGPRLEAYTAFTEAVPVIEKSKGGGFQTEKAALVAIKNKKRDPNDYKIIKAADGYIAVPKPYTASQAQSDVYWGEVGKKYFPKDWTQADEQKLQSARSVLARENGATAEYSAEREAFKGRMNKIGVVERQDQAEGTELARVIAKDKPGVTVTIWEMPESVVRKGDITVPRNSFEFTTKIAGIFGKKVEWITAEGITLNGVVVPKSKTLSDKIYIDIRTQKPTHVVYGHELLHHLKASFPAEYKAFMSAMDPLIKGQEKYAQRKGLSLTDEQLKDEIAADLLGDHFNDMTFWQEVAAQSPSTFAKVAGRIRTWLTQLIGKLKSAGFGAEEYVTDLQEARKNLVDLVARVSTTKGRAELASEAGSFFSTAPQMVENATPKAMFSLVDDRLKANISKVNTMAKALADPKSAAHNTWLQFAPKILAVTPLQTLVDTFGKGKPVVKSYADALRAVGTKATAIVDEATYLYKDAIKVAEAGPGVKAFNKAAELASFHRMTPWLSKYEQDWVPEGLIGEEALKQARDRWANARMKDATGLTYDQAYAQAATAYKQLGKETQEAYVKIVEHLAAIRRRERNNLLAHIENNTVGNPELRAQLMEQFNATFSTLQGAYWPLSRVGDYRLEYLNKDGKRVVRHFESAYARTAEEALLKMEGISEFKRDFKDKQTRTSAAIPNELMAQLKNVVLEKRMEGVDPNNESAMLNAQAAVDDIIDDMNQVWLRWQPETSALKNSIRRRNVLGYSENMLHSYLSYVQNHAANIAWTEQSRKIEDAITEYSENVKDKKDKGADTTVDNMVINDMRNRVHALRTAKIGKVASTIGKLSTGYYMTSPSIALVQMSQLAALTLPKLSVMYSPVKAAKAMQRGLVGAFSKDFSREAMFADPVVNEVFHNLHAVVNEENRNEPAAKDKLLGEELYDVPAQLAMIAKLDPKQKQLLTLREAAARNLLDVSAAHEAYAITQGKDPNSLRRRIFDLAMKPMALSELASRKAAILATAELAGGKDFFAAMNDIAEVVDDTLYSYARESKGAALQGGAVRVLLQFQHYRMMTALRLAMLGYDSIKGESPEVRTAARKELTGIMGITGALAGSLGLPMSKALFAAMSAVFGSDDEPYDAELEFTNWLRENLGETGARVAMSGLPALAGVNLTGRIGLADIYGMQNEPPPGTHGRELAMWWAASQLGPAFSVGSSWVQGYDEIVRKGNLLKGLEVATPKPIRDALKSYRVATEGLKTSAGKKLMPDENIGPNDIVMLAMGFNAEDIAQAYSANRTLTKISTIISERRGALMRDAVKAFVDGGDVEAAKDKIVAFNQRMPQYAISPGEVRSALRKQIKGEMGVTGPRERAVAGQYGVPVYMQ